jgi:hypothetical protein
MKKLAVVVLCACGGASSPPPAVTVVPATTTSATTTTTTATKHALALAPQWEAKMPADARVAFDGHRLFFAVKGTLTSVDAHGPVLPGPPSARRIAVGPDVFDPSSFAKHTPPMPKGLECGEPSYSADVSRMSLDCHDAKGDDAVYVYDARNGALIGRFDEFQTAAPIRGGAITESGNFVFWSARAGGAFEEIKSHVVGPAMSSMSAMSRDESMLFTTPNKQWYTDDTTPAKILDPKNGRVLMTLDSDVTSITFAPRGGLFALHHSSRWKDMNFDKPDLEWITVRDGDASVKLDATRVMFGDDGATLAATSDDVVRVYAITFLGER